MIRLSAFSFHLSFSVALRPDLAIGLPFSVTACPGRCFQESAGAYGSPGSLPYQQVRPRFEAEHSGLLLILARPPSEGRCGPSRTSACIVYRDYLSLLPAVLV